MTPAEPDTGYFARAQRAISLAAQDFGPVTRPYNTAALPTAQTGDWFVYLVPAPTRLGYWPHGGDARYRISADGRTLREKRRMHNAVIEYGPPPKDGTQRVAAGHSAVLWDAVEDTDVFLVLTRQPPMPEYIGSETFYFQVDLDGRITAYDHEKVSK